jgi:SAM-dependent methyltransferase
MFFLRKPKLASLPLAMSGVRMGERALQIGIDDPSLAGAIASKVGLSGQAAIVVGDEAAAESARNAAAKAGALVDVHVAPLATMPFSASSFDVAVLHSTKGWLASLDESQRSGIIGEALRVLRSGGRLIVIEASRGGPGVGVEALALGGFRAARVLAEREGYRFTEGLKPGV